MLSRKLSSLGVNRLKAPPAGPRRLILSLEGLEKQGKTHLSLTAPKPLLIFNLDIGLEGVLEKFKDQEIFTYESGEYDTQAEAEKAWNGFKSVFLASLKDPDLRTVVIDTATEAWEVIRMARLGKLTQVQPYHYGPVNAEFRLLLKRAYDSNKNLILVHKMKPLYINDKRSGKYERAGFNDTGFLVQASVRVYRDEDGEFCCEVRDCRQNAELAGEELEGPMCTFPWLGMSVYPDSGLEDWE